MPLLRGVVKEEWKEYHGYFVSNRGNIMNKRGKIIKPYLSITKKGEKRYETLKVHLYIAKHRACRSVSSLVNKLFIGGGRQSFHKDKNPLNNSMDNLRAKIIKDVAPHIKTLYEKNVVGCVRHFIGKQRGFIELQKYGFDLDNAGGNAYLNIWKNLGSYNEKYSFYAFCAKYTRWALLEEYQKYKKEREKTIPFDANVGRHDCK